MQFAPVNSSAAELQPSGSNSADFQVRRSILFGGLALGIAPSIARAAIFPSHNQLYSEYPGNPVENLWFGPVRSACQSVARIVWDGGERGASGVLVGDDWLLTAGHNFDTESGLGSRVFIFDFQESVLASSRRYYVRDRNTDMVKGDRLAGLDYALVKLTPVDSESRVNFDDLTGVYLRGRNTDATRHNCADAYVIGHPESGDACYSVFRSWAYKTVKATKLFAKNERELLLSTSTCAGHSGSAIVDRDGYLLGIVCAETARVSGALSPRALPVNLIAEDAKLKFMKSGLKLPTGLESLLPASIKVGSKCQDTPQLTYSDSVMPEKPTDGDAPPENAADAVLELISRVGYVWFDERNTDTGAGCCFLLGEGWVLTAKHVLHNRSFVLDARITFDFTREKCLEGRQSCDSRQLGNLVKRRQFLTLAPSCYFSSNDGIDSETGKSRTLDYALLRLSGQAASESIHKSSYDKFRAVSTAPSRNEILHIPQHRQNTAKYWPQIDKVRNRVVNVDSNRLYYHAAVDSGASGSPIFNSRLQLVGMHTNSRDAACSRPSEQGRRDNCPPKRYWEESRTPAREESDYGTRITEIIQDLRLRHQIDTDRIPAFRDVVLGDNFDYKIGASNAK